MRIRYSCFLVFGACYNPWFITLYYHMVNKGMNLVDLQLTLYETNGAHEFFHDIWSFWRVLSVELEHYGPLLSCNLAFANVVFFHSYCREWNKDLSKSCFSKMNKGKIFKLAKGFRGRAKNCIRITRERVEKALQYSYRDRCNKKRDMRSLWIERINAGTRLHGVCLHSTSK